MSVLVADDCERFANADDFLNHVTPEALQRFEAIKIHVVVQRRIMVDVRLFRAPLRTAFWAERDAGVTLEVRAGHDIDERAVCAVINDVRAAVERGRGRSWTILSGSPDEGAHPPRLPPARRMTNEDWLFRGLFAVAFNAVLNIAAAAVLYLAGEDSLSDGPNLWATDSDLLRLVGGPLALIVGTIIAGGFRPPVEVAPPGQTRLRRTTKYVATIGAGLAVSVIGKRVLKI
jgi:hypothetical protein